MLIVGFGESGRNGCEKVLEGEEEHGVEVGDACGSAGRGGVRV